MKKIIILLFVVSLTSNMFSQSLKVLDTKNVDKSGTTYTVNGDVSDIQAVFYAHIQNVGGQSIQTMACKHVIYQNGIASNTFCFGVYCYTSDTAGHSVSIASGSIDNSFDATVYLTGSVGTTQIIYTFWDDNNPSDNVSVTVNYDITTSIGSNKFESDYLSKPYPVPANDYINFDYSIDHNAEINIYDITGKTVLKKTIESTQNKLRLPIKNFNPGIYYYSFIIDNKKIKTDKFIIN